jgi:protein SCO1/2
MTFRRVANLVLLSGLLMIGGAEYAAAQVPPPPSELADRTPPVLRNIRIDQKLDSQVPPDLTFKDETGQTVRLGDYFGKRPMILVLVYFKCPQLCTVVLTDLLHSLNGLVGMSVGEQFDILTVSFDPRETPELAAAKKRSYLKEYGRASAAQGWHFLTGQQPQIAALADSVGFRYEWSEEYKQYMHASGLMILTPQGKVSQYFYGIDYAANDLRLALNRAGTGEIGAPADEILFYCLHYDPRTGRYGLIIDRVLKLSGVLTVMALSAFLLVMFRRGPGVAVASGPALGEARATTAPTRTTETN